MSPPVTLLVCFGSVLLTFLLSVLNPSDAPFDRDDIKSEAKPTDRLAFADASPVSKLPFSSISYAADDATYTTPALLKTLIAVDVSALATPTGGPDAKSTPTGEAGTVSTGAGSRLVASGAAIFALAVSLLMI